MLAVLDVEGKLIGNTLSRMLLPLVSGTLVWSGILMVFHRGQLEGVWLGSILLPCSGNRHEFSLEVGKRTCFCLLAGKPLKELYRKHSIKRICDDARRMWEIRDELLK